jgi:hypothetical protein
MSDESVRQNIIDEPEFEPSLNAANIRVAVDKKIQIENKQGGQIMIFGWWSGRRQCLSSGPPMIQKNSTW